MREFKIHEGEKIKAGFNTPEGYFDTFADKLMLRLPEHKPEVIPLYRRIPTWMGAAAAFIIMLTVGLFFVVNPKKTSPDETAIESYLVYGTNVTTYDLAQQLDQQDIKELETSLAISDDAIEEYLLNGD